MEFLGNLAENSRMMLLSEMQEDGPATCRLKNICSWWDPLLEDLDLGNNFHQFDSISPLTRFLLTHLNFPNLARQFLQKKTSAEISKSIGAMSMTLAALPSGQAGFRWFLGGEGSSVIWSWSCYQTLVVCDTY